MTVNGWRREPLATIIVRFEQARGETGVPKCFLTRGSGTAGFADLTPELLTRMAVAVLRVECEAAHGRDLMPAGDEGWSLHDIDGVRLADTKALRWNTEEVGQRAELVLCWQNPAKLFMDAVESA